MAPAVVAFAVTPRFPSLRAVRAVAGDAEDEWGKEPADQGGAASTVAETPVASEVAEMKVNLKEALYGTERGLRASSETQAEVVEIITLLNGKWILAVRRRERAPLEAAQDTQALDPEAMNQGHYGYYKDQDADWNEGGED